MWRFELGIVPQETQRLHEYESKADSEVAQLGRWPGQLADSECHSLSVTKL